MSPARKKATSTRHAKAKRAAKRSRGRRKTKAARRAKAAAKAPSLAIVARAAAKPRPKKSRPATAVSEFAGATAGASAKDLALFGLERARVSVHAAIQGLGVAAANRPVGEDKWSARQIVLHLAFWDREIVQKYLEAAAARNQRAGIRHAEIEAMNTAGLAPLEHHDWESAKRLLQTTHDALWDALDSIPADPPETWSREHAVGELVWEITKHDRHHADVIKRWRAESGT